MWPLDFADFSASCSKSTWFSDPNPRSSIECRMKSLPIHIILDLDLSISSFGIVKKVRDGVRIRPRTRVANIHFRVSGAKVPLKFVAQRWDWHHPNRHFSLHNICENYEDLFFEIDELRGAVRPTNFFFSLLSPCQSFSSFCFQLEKVNFVKKY